MTLQDFTARFRAFPVLALGLLASCGGSSTTTTTTNGVTLTNQYALAYQSAKYASEVSINFTSACSMTLTSTGAPYSHATYYLAPVQNGGTVVATTPSGIQLGVTPYSSFPTASTISATFNVCPTKATSTTATSGGGIGVIFSGSALFDAYEATQTVALADNASYTFTSGGTSYTASFLDTCNQHTTGGATNSGAAWHYHGNPNCWTSVVDGTANGPSHIIGIALDGFPIYGGRDVNGAVVPVASLDACNGITSATPEFPSGAYHYVLPIDSNGNAITTKQSSINCYAGTPSNSTIAALKKLACKMPMLLASGKLRLPDGREVSRQQAAAWMQQTMPGMNMGGSMPGMNMAAAAPAGEQGKTPPKHSGMNMPGM